MNDKHVMNRKNESACKNVVSRIDLGIDVAEVDRPPNTLYDTVSEQLSMTTVGYY